MTDFQVKADADLVWVLYEYKVVSRTFACSALRNAVETSKKKPLDNIGASVNQ